MVVRFFASLFCKYLFILIYMSSVSATLVADEIRSPPKDSTAEPFIVSESALLKAAKDEPSLSVARINSLVARSDLVLANVADAYRWELFGSGMYGESKRSPTGTGFPVLSPNESYELGVSKKLSYGVTTKLSTFAEHSEVSVSGADSATTGVKLGVEFDIWSNVLGRLDQAKLQQANLIKERAQLEAQIERIKFESRLRKIYWSLVANQESFRITQEIRKTAQIQLAEARRRLAASVANPSEVARYEAQLASRDGTLSALEFQREKLYSQIKVLLPSLAHRKLMPGSYSIDQTVQEVLQCTNLISQSKETPWNYTRFDELLAVHEKAYEAQQKVTGSRNNANAALFSELSYAGSKEQIDGAYEEFQKDPKQAYTIGLRFTVPIGSAASAAQVAQKQSEMQEFMAQKLAWESDVMSRHSQMIPLISYLNASFQAQGINGAQLEKAIAATKRLYEQARVSVDAIINDQNAYLAAMIDQINTRLAIVHEVIDYLEVYDQTPCVFNLIRAHDSKG